MGPPNAREFYALDAVALPDAVPQRLIRDPAFWLQLRRPSPALSAQPLRFNVSAITRSFISAAGRVVTAAISDGVRPVRLPGPVRTGGFNSTDQPPRMQAGPNSVDARERGVVQ